MTAKTRTIDELIKLSLKVSNAWLNKPTDKGNAIASKAILAVCKHLSHEASYRTDIAELIRTCQSAAKLHGGPVPLSALTTPQAQSNKVLTARQSEILQLFARGLSYQEVAAQLLVSTQTIKNHASAIYERLGVKNKTEAVFEARATGMVL
jgi:DNA-binding NarL/FixJ family response regulator